jgi:hypothetical protein
MKAKFQVQGVTFAEPSASSRRRNLRLGPPDRLGCSIKELSARFVPKDISAGGLSVVSELALGVGEIHEVTLTLDELHVVRFAKVIHCRACDGNHWISGLAFLNVHRDGATIEDLLDRIAPELRKS